MYSSNVIYMVRWPYFRGAINLIRNSRLSSSAKPIILGKNLSDIDPKGDTNVINDNFVDTTNKTKGTVRKSLIASAFAPLKNRPIKKFDSVDDSIIKATSPDQLLSLVDTCKLSRRHTLKIISILAEWSATGEIDMKDFERDSRFTSLCQTLGRPYNPVQKVIKTQTDDLTMVLNVKNDDEASKIITTFTQPQMIKVLSSLALKKRRSVPLLRSLSFSLTQNSNKLDVKQGADILYALACLNYPDEVLLEKVSSDLVDSIPKCKKTSVIGSISTSLGILRYKDTELLDSLCEWTNKNLDIRNQDLSAILFTLAHVNYQPTSEKFFLDVRRKLLLEDHNLTRLDVIWALTILNQASHEDYASVLSSIFYDKLQATHPSGLPLTRRRKLLNINGAAKLSEGYEGPLLEIEDEFDILLTRSKEKQILVTSVFEALSNLLPSSVYLRTNVNLNMGFAIDGECLVDSKMTPLPLIDRKTGAVLETPKKGIKIAVFVWDYHEHTKGHVELCGVPTFCQRLAAALGYRILSIPYSNFQSKDKLIDRVKYLEKNLKLLVSKV